MNFACPRPEFLIAAIAGACSLAAGPAGADGRFGDSTWVAPTVPFAQANSDDGPRVAAPDRPRAWETALRTPFRVAFFPLRLVSLGLEDAAGVAGPRFLDPKPRRAPNPGPAFAPHFRVGGVSDLGLGPGLRWVGLPSGLSTLSITTSLSTQDRRAARLKELIGDRRPVGFLLRANYDYEPNKDFYGIGNRSSHADSSVFLLASTNVEGTLLLGASPHRQLRFVGGYSSLSPMRGYFGAPLLEDVFAPGEVPFEHRTTKEFEYGVAGDLAALDDGKNPSRGVHGRVDLRRNLGVRADDPDYDQWQVEGRAYVPVFAKHRVFALRGVYTGVDPRGGATALPYYRLMTNDDATSFAGYSADRFTDRQLLLGRIEYRWTLLYDVSAVALYELGEVAPTAAAFTLRDTHRSYGGGLRYALSDRSTLRFEVGKSVEGVHVAFRMGSDF